MEFYFYKMQKKYTYGIGLMSGTSLDGVDLVYVNFNLDDYKDYTIIACQTIPYTAEWKMNLKKAITFSSDALLLLDMQYGELLGNTINKFITCHKIKKIDFIASHGHTVFHQPEKGITLQIGSGQKIAAITKQLVICDFRSQDVKLGGQGAPLVPIGDELLFSDYHYCLNLGGFANVSFKDKQHKRVAFDVCPVNIVLNHYVQLQGLDYDDKGLLAQKGNVHAELLTSLNSLEFYQQDYPKSLGLEWVQEFVFPLLDSYSLKVEDVLRTYVEHIAIQISGLFTADTKVLITGGGAYHEFLIQRIQKLSNSSIVLPQMDLIEYKEALIFAFLGLLRLKNEFNCLQSVTGATHDHSSGVIFNPA